jgi:hypothetical protein
VYLVSREKFTGSFRLHVEFRLPPRAEPETPGTAKSGILVQGRYLLPIANSDGQPLDEREHHRGDLSQEGPLH